MQQYAGRRLSARARYPRDLALAGAKEPGNLHLHPRAGKACHFQIGGTARHAGIANHHIGAGKILGVVPAQYVADRQSHELVHAWREHLLRTQIGDNYLGGAVLHSIARRRNAATQQPQPHHQHAPSSQRVRVLWRPNHVIRARPLIAHALLLATNATDSQGRRTTSRPGTPGHYAHQTSRRPVSVSHGWSYGYRAVPHLTHLRLKSPHQVLYWRYGGVGSTRSCGRLFRFLPCVLEEESVFPPPN